MAWPPVLRSSQNIITIYPYYMPTITLTGSVTEANGETLSLILYNDQNTVVWREHPNAGFSEDIDLEPGNYSLDMIGATQGKFKFDITGCTSNPAVPKNYNQRISDSFDLTV